MMFLCNFKTTDKITTVILLLFFSFYMQTFANERDNVSKHRHNKTIQPAYYTRYYNPYSGEEIINIKAPEPNVKFSSGGYTYSGYSFNRRYFSYPFKRSGWYYDENGKKYYVTRPKIITIPKPNNQNTGNQLNSSSI